MTAIDFPNSPSLDQVFTVGSRSWKWNGTVWQTITTQTGSQGDKGGLKYNFSTSTTMSEPAQGIVRFNNSTIADVTAIAIDNQTSQGADVSDFFADLATSLPDELSVIKYYMILQSNDNSDSTYCIFAITDVTDNTSWLQLDATYVSGSLPADNEDLVIALSRVGDLGPTGPETSITLGTIDTGLPGSTAAAAITGPPGDQVLSLTIPQGPTGPETSISLGTIDTGLPGSTAAADITGPPGDQVLSLTIPQGPTGPGGVYQYSVTGPTAPTLINGEPVAEGDTWFNSETGRFYIYYDGYWVENTSSLVGPTGPLGVNWQGTYDTGPSSTYVINDLVESNGSTYICTLPVTAGNASLYTPEEGSHWDLVALGNVTGPAGDPTLVITTPTITAGAYTVQLSDASKLLQINNGASATTVFIPTDATANFPIGTQINIVRINTGSVTIAATTPGTTTVNATPSLILRDRWSSATLIKRAANTWLVSGDMA